MKQKIKAILAASLVAALSCSAFGATATSNLQVTATVTAQCFLQGANIYFNTVDFGGGDASGNLSIRCSNTVPYTISLGTGNGTIAQRTMVGSAGNTDKLNYNVYLDSSHTSIFGDASGGSATVTGAGTGTEQLTTIYGKIPMAQLVKPDNYADTVTLTVTY